jgi:hypothetical protein
MVSPVQKWYRAIMEDKREKIGPKTVAEAIKAAKAGHDGVLEFVDELHPYLILRVRGHSVSWLVKTRERTKKIGTPLPVGAALPGRSRQRASAASATLTLRQARDIAKKLWATLHGMTAPEPKPETWTWEKLADDYKAYTSGFREDGSGKTIYPSEETASDVRQAFACPPIAAWKRVLLVDLNEDIRRSGLLTLGYQHHPDRAYVALIGGAAHRRQMRNRRRWIEKWRLFFPGGPGDPDTIFVRMNVDRIELCVRGVTPEPFGSRPSVIERGDDRTWKVVSD